MKTLLGLAAVTAMLTLAAAAPAHHSLAVEFDSLSIVKVEGVVNEVWFKNPHVRYYLTVVDDAGEEVIWDTHAHNIAAMTRQGYTKDTLKVGDAVVMEGHGTRDGSPKLFIRAWTLPDGVRRPVGNANIDAF